MDQVTRALSPDEIARVEARQKLQAGGVGKAPPRFVEREGTERETVIPLDFPVEYDGVLYEEVRIRRPVMREWRSYLRACEDAVKERGPGADDLVDQPWLSAPAIVLEHLDFVDATRVEAAQEGFFGRLSSTQGTDEDQSSPPGSSTGEA